MATAAAHQPYGTAEDTDGTGAYERAFDAAVAADERIEPRDWMPDAYR
ncbi:MAG: 1,2-phenylacetyl-CoA epoxidase subunit A, partial [Streptomyces sp.]|nr:1,2-phenylacetyl-CoA epoxidase subunit A [Streptomyces sp.]